MSQLSTMLTSLEQSVLDVLLDCKGEPFATIRKQLSHATVVSRKFTGVGFYTDFAVDPDAEVRLNLPDASLTNVAAEIRGLEHGAGFVLFVRNGVISMLEGFTFDENWPQNVDEFSVYKPRDSE